VKSHRRGELPDLLEPPPPPVTLLLVAPAVLQHVVMAAEGAGAAGEVALVRTLARVFPRVPLQILPPGEHLQTHGALVTRHRGPLPWGLHCRRGTSSSSSNSSSSSGGRGGNGGGRVRLTVNQDWVDRGGGGGGRQVKHRRNWRQK